MAHKTISSDGQPTRRMSAEKETPAPYHAYVLYREANQRLEVVVAREEPRLGPYRLHMKFQLESQPKSSVAAEKLGRDLTKACRAAPRPLLSGFEMQKMLGG